MATDTEKLVVLLEARVTQFEKNMQKAQRTAGKEFDKIEQRARQSRRRLEESLNAGSHGVADMVGNLSAAFARGGVVVAGAAAAAAAVKQIASSVAEVGREAKKAGVSAQSWQRWTAVAVATGATIDGVTDALKELNIRGDEFAQTDAGPAAESFKRLGFTATEIARKLKDPDALLDEILAKVRQLDQAAQTRVLDELFGGTGAEQVAKFLGLSVEEMKSVRAEASTLTDEQIAAATEIDRKWATVWRNFSIAGKGAILDVFGYLDSQFTAAQKSSWGTWLREQLNPQVDIRELIKKAEDDAAKDAAADRKAYLVKRRDELKDAIFQEAQAAIMERLRSGELKIGEEFKVDSLLASRAAMELEGVLKELAQSTSEDINRMNTSFDGLHQQMSDAQPYEDFREEIERNRLATQNFADAIRTLKGLVPELAAELDVLAKSNEIDTAFQKAAQQARTLGEIYQAADIASRAHAAQEVSQLPGSTMDRGREIYQMLRERGVNHAAAAGMVGNIYQESRFDQTATGDGGTSHGLFQHHADRMSALFAAGGRNNAGKQLDFAIREMQQSGLWEQMQAMTDPAEAARLFMEKFEAPAAATANLASRQEFARTAGTWGDGLKELNSERGPQQDAHVTARAEALQREAEIRGELNRTVQESLELARFEQSIAGVSASQQQVEREMFNIQLEARRQGIDLSQQELDAMRAKITETAKLGEVTQGVVDTTAGMQQAQQYLAQSFTDLFSGIITGSMSAEDALRRLLDQLVQVLIQGALMGSGPLGGLFGGGIFPALFGFSEGGPIRGYASGGRVRGPGTSTSDSIPAMLSDGEFVINAAQARKHRALLEAINSGQIRGFAAGGLAGTGGPIRAGERSTTFSPVINVNVEGGSRGEQADQKMGANIAKQVESSLRGLIAEEMRIATRPGNFANRRGR